MTPVIINLEPPDETDLAFLLFERLGYHHSPIPEKIRQLAKSSIRAALTHVVPKAIYNIETVTQITDSHIITDNLKIKSQSWSGMLKSATGTIRIASFALTLGENLDTEIKKAGTASLSQSYFLFETGSVIIETIANRVEKMIARRQRWGHLKASRRFSPGYCDIPLSLQVNLMAFLSVQKIGLHVKPSGAMLPEKSITAITVYTNDLPFRSPCRICNNTKCGYRR